MVQLFDDVHFETAGCKFFGIFWIFSIFFSLLFAVLSFRFNIDDWSNDRCSYEWENSRSIWTEMDHVTVSNVLFVWVVGNFIFRGNSSPSLCSLLRSTLTWSRRILQQMLNFSRSRTQPRPNRSHSLGGMDYADPKKMSGVVAKILLAAVLSMQMSASEIIQLPYISPGTVGKSDGNSGNQGSDNLLEITPNTFMDDFPTDIFDHFDEPLPSPSNWLRVR